MPEISRKKIYKTIRFKVISRNDFINISLIYLDENAQFIIIFTPN